MILARFDNDSSDVSLWFEDDGRVAYAYLKRGEKFVADVWVYNRAESPTAPEWKEGKRPPFLNVRSCIAEIMPFVLPTSEQDIGVRWINEEGRPPEAELILGVHVAARLRDGDKPSFAAAAIRDNPVARRLHV